MPTVIDGIKRGVESEIKPRLDQHPEVLDALRKGNVHDVLKALPSGVTKADVEEYLRHRWAVLDQGLFQNSQIKSDEFSVPPVTMEDIPAMAAENALTAEEQNLLKQGLGGFKAAKVSRSMKGGKFADDAGAETKGPAPVSGAATGGVGEEQLGAMIESDLAELDSFMIDIQNKIFEAQLTQELESRRAELKKKLQEIMALFRAGLILPEFVLIALAKVQISERGLLVTQYGQRTMHTSQEQSRIAKDIDKLGSDPTKWGKLEVMRQQMGEKTLHLQQFAQMMQKISQDIESIFAFAKGAGESIRETKRGMQRNIGAAPQ